MQITRRAELLLFAFIQGAIILDCTASYELTGTTVLDLKTSQSWRYHDPGKFGNRWASELDMLAL